MTRSSERSRDRHDAPSASGTERPSRARQRLLWLCVLCALAAGLGFWAATRWTIEDGLIIARMARNLAQGHGLVFNPGTRASAATSPVFAASAGILARVGLSPVASAKFLGALAGAASAGLLFWWLCGEFRPAYAFPGALLYALFPPVIAYAVGGMETSAYTLACFAALAQSARGRHGWALAWGAAATVLRPDGLIALAVAGAFAAWAFRLPQERRAVWIGVVSAAGILAAAMLAHRAYYGAWLPQTMMAKGIAYRIDPWSNTARYLRRMFLSQPYGVPVYVLACIGLLRGKRWARWGPLAAWYAVYHAAFFLRAPLFSWYLQPPLIVLVAFAGAAIADAGRFVARRISRRPEPVATALAIAVLAVSLPADAYYASTRRAYQRHEEEVRMAAGAWLSEATAPTDLVFTESLGYVGFFCRNPIVDWPGLAVPDVAPMLQAEGLRGRRLAGYRAVIRDYAPAWLVLRTQEWESLRKTLGADYDVRASFPKGAPPEYVVCGRSIDA